jgi:hypothetical protein
MRRTNSPHSFNVMAARVAAIHVFGAVGKIVDGRARPGHDVRKAPVVNTIFNRKSRYPPAKRAKRAARIS